MNCTKIDCDGKLAVKQTYTVGSARYQRAVCQACGQVHKISAIAEPVNRRGEGARAAAEKESCLS